VVEGSRLLSVGDDTFPTRLGGGEGTFPRVADGEGTFAPGGHLSLVDSGGTFAVQVPAARPVAGSGGRLQRPRAVLDRPPGVVTPPKSLPVDP